MPQPPIHRLLVSLGSNSPQSDCIQQALDTLKEHLCIGETSPLMRTAPVDFPYPSADFWNIILWAETSLTRQEVDSLLQQLEYYAGRDRSTPQLVPLDADLIIWDGEVLKPQDLKRPYFEGFDISRVPNLGA